MCSGGRDRMIHVFSVSGGYENVDTLEDHASGVIAIKLITVSCSLSCYSWFHTIYSKIYIDLFFSLR